MLGQNIEVYGCFAQMQSCVPMVVLPQQAPGHSEFLVHGVSQWVMSDG